MPGIRLYILRFSDLVVSRGADENTGVAGSSKKVFDPQKKTSDFSDL